jgi:hypothetical protein
MDEFEKPDLTIIEKRYLKKVQSKIEYCLYCQPFDEGDAVWIYGDRIELCELFYESSVPEKFWDKITKHLYCPYCGNTNLDLSIDVGLRSKYDIEVDKHYDEAKLLYGRDVKEFEDLLESYPLLAFQNNLAKRIYKEIKERKLPTISIKGKFYRARKVENSEVIKSNKMYNPPLGKPQEGRFNHSGQSHLYLANDKETAIREVVSDEHSLLVWCQEFEILNEVTNILDLSFDWSNLTPSTSTLLISLKINNSIGRSDRNKQNWRPDYYLTRYIMDCAKSLGYNGIKYNSAKESYSFTFDVVLFFPETINIQPIGNPLIEIFLNKEEIDKLTTDLSE